MPCADLMNIQIEHYNLQSCYIGTSNKEDGQVLQQRVFSHVILDQELCSEHSHRSGGAGGDL